MIQILSYRDNILHVGQWVHATARLPERCKCGACRTGTVAQIALGCIRAFERCAVCDAEILVRPEPNMWWPRDPRSFW